MKQIIQAINNRDGRALSAMLPPEQKQTQPQSKSEVAAIVNALFEQLRAAFPATSAQFNDPQSQNNLRRQWILAFMENGITRIDQISAGMKKARASESPFLPSPGLFISWCKEGEAIAAGLPNEDQLFDMVKRYCAERGLYDSPESFPWESAPLYWLVTGLYSEMRNKNLTDSELRKACRPALVAMSKRIAAGDTINPPCLTIEKKIIPVSQERAKQHCSALSRLRTSPAARKAAIAAREASLKRMAGQQ